MGMDVNIWPIKPNRSKLIIDFAIRKKALKQ